MLITCICSITPMLDRIFKLTLLPLTVIYSYQDLLLKNQDIRVNIPCLFSSIFHVECWGCGMSRALKRLWHGDIAGASQFNYLVFPVVAILLALFMFECYKITKSITSKGVFRG